MTPSSLQQECQAHDSPGPVPESEAGTWSSPAAHQRGPHRGLQRHLCWKTGPGLAGATTVGAVPAAVLSGVRAGSGPADRPEAAFTPCGKSHSVSISTELCRAKGPSPASNLSHSLLATAAPLSPSSSSLRLRLEKQAGQTWAERGGWERRCHRRHLSLGDQGHKPAVSRLQPRPDIQDHWWSSRFAIVFVSGARDTDPTSRRDPHRPRRQSSRWWR